MSSPEKKRKTTTLTKKPSPVLTPMPSLPDDLLLSCFARVSRLYYPTLSLVSKSFGSFLVSPELHQTRSLLGRSECSLYVCLRYRLDCKPCWFTLCRKPNRTGTTKSSGYVLARVPMPHSPEIHHAGLVSVGCNIYAIGVSEPIKYVPSPNVWILDCRSHTWHEAPSMQVKRSYPTANFVDGKIYVAGGCSSSNLVEVFDPETQTWNHVVNPLASQYPSHIYKSAVIDGEIHMYVGPYDSVVYNPKEDRWSNMGLRSSWLCCCVIRKVLYCYTELREIKWFNSVTRKWIVLNGVKGVLMFSSKGLVKLVDYGGKMAVFWDKNETSSGYDEDKVIGCAIISLERRNNDEEIWGEVEWCEEVLTVPKSYGFINALSVTV